MLGGVWKQRPKLITERQAPSVEKKIGALCARFHALSTEVLGLLHKPAGVRILPDPDGFASCSHPSPSEVEASDPALPDRRRRHIGFSMWIGGCRNAPEGAAARGHHVLVITSNGRQLRTLEAGRIAAKLKVGDDDSPRYITAQTDLLRVR